MFILYLRKASLIKYIQYKNIQMECEEPFYKKLTCLHHVIFISQDFDWGLCTTAGLKAVGLKTYFIYFCFVVNWKLFWYELCQKNQFFRLDFVDFETVIWGLTSLPDFCKQAHIL